ncbi:MULTISPECIES: RrF2 family transcriptional regulator [Anaerotruncus]|jgi:Rrf2 family protein|uniref:RrF2 family transcriptional regulator n=1 Tax=Anaerotruncus TaxID=244127 RepID=UPI00082FE48C|nr:MULTISPECIES: Rrf2 family transcriptional regulator [Anaerotruncus]RGX55748.1 Rrf2 family transcriptional regulator [Anaerotruncus sp. AF02-27]
MKISTKGRYALRLMIDLAQHDAGEYISLKEISGRQEISVKYLEQIVILLAKAGFLRSVRGPQGGYKLAKPPQEYKVGDILRLTEGSLAPVACLEHEPNECARYGECPTIAFWQGLAKVVNNYVDGITLQDLVPSSQDNYMI